MTTSIAELNSMADQDAAALLAGCCGSRRWVEEILACRPFSAREELLTAADEVWASLAESDFVEAFAHHPRIGEQHGAKSQGEQGSEWSAKEQAGLVRAGEEIRAALAETNREYERRFGYIYIVCATGKNGDDMLTLARERLRNDATTELAIAAEEQRKITKLRLEKLLDR